MKKLLPILFILLSLTTRAQSLHIDSTRFITGINCCTQITCVIPTSDKGILFTGSENNNPGGIIPYFPLDTSGGGNVMIGKIDSNRQISWIRIYGSSGGDGASNACQLPDGGYAVMANTTAGDGDVTNFHGGNDYWLLRLDDSGKLLWENCYGGPGGEQATSIALTPDGGFILLGTTNEAGGEVTLHYGNDFDYDWWVVKTDSLGNIQWVQTLGGAGQEESGSILSIDSAYYLIGSSNSTDHNCTDTFWHPGVSTGYDYYILKLDTGGNVLWDSSYGGSNDEDEAYAMYDTRDSTIVINGGTHSNDYMVTGYQGNGDMWVIKVNKNGTLIWEKALGYATADNGANGICTGPNGGYMAYGGTTAGMTSTTNAWIVSLDSNGNEITDKIFGGNGNVQPYCIIPYLNGYAACGLSTADSFTEGTTYGKFANYQNAFISYISYWPLGVQNISTQNQQLNIYPNPTQNNVSILLTDNTTGGFVTIQNILGQIIYTATIKSNTAYIDITTEEWAKGLYLVKWQGEDGMVLTGKLVIN